MAIAKKPTARKRSAPQKSSVVSGMPDGSDVPRPSTRDDLEAAFSFVKKSQGRRTPPK